MILPSKKLVGATLALVAVVCVAGLINAIVISVQQIDRTDGAEINIFYYLVANFEPTGASLMLLLCGLLYLTMTRARLVVPDRSGVVDWATKLPTARAVFLVSAIVFCVCWAGSQLVFHDYPLAMDEFNLHYQAQIFARGQLSVPIAEQWKPFGGALTPIFVGYHPDSLGWLTKYLPVYAGLLTPFELLGIASAANPVLAVIGLLALAGTIRNIWPDGRANPIVGVVLLASSSQFLITSMSFYSMPAHLCFNLLWLYLYTSNTRWKVGLAAWVGVLAMGLHQWVPHALFAAPFGLRMLFERRWARALYFGTIYVGAVVMWLAWTFFVRPGATGIDKSQWSVPGLDQLVIQLANLSHLITWQSISLVVLAALGVSQWKKLPTIAKDVAFSALLTFSFYVFLRLNQGHGWGNRYFYAVLGNLALLAVPGWRVLRDALGGKQAAVFVAIGIFAACAVQLPIRAVQVESVVAPFARTSAYIRSLPEATVLVHPQFAWYAQDLVRNRPFLDNRPKVMFAHGLTPAGLKALRRRGSVRVLSPREMKAHGMFLTTVEGLKNRRARALAKRRR